MTATTARTQRLTVLVPARSRSHHHSLVTELLARARRAHLAGATVLETHDLEGQPVARHPHSLLAGDVALSVLIVDDHDKLARFVEENTALLAQLDVHLDDVTAFRA